MCAELRVDGHRAGEEAADYSRGGDGTKDLRDEDYEAAEPAVSADEA